ncbi:MAG: hypothetical protein JXB32_22670 [Deltaproteobacteria bacterium]|nr:hypothetical protein [Deltaproteobacteria bacterium]
MKPPGIAGNAATALVLLVVVGCSGASVVGAQDGDDGRADSSGMSDGEVADGGDGGWEDAEPPPVAPPHCGDGVLDPDEECDDGNRLDGDDCDWLCRLGPGEPVDDTPDPSVGDLERDLPWTSVVSPSPPAFVGYNPSLPLLWTGSAYATAWILVDSDGGRGEDAQFRLFDRLGRRTVPDWTYPDWHFETLDLAWSGRFFALVWSSDGPLWAMILDDVGKPLVGPFTLVEGSAGSDVTVTWDGEAFAAVWRWGDAAEGSDLGIARFDEVGSILSVVSSVYEAPPGTNLARPSSASSPAATVTAFIEFPEVPPALDYICRLGWLASTRDAELLRPPAELGQAQWRPMTIEWGERGFGLAFVPAYTSTDPVHLALLDPAGMLVGPVRPVCSDFQLCSRFMAMAWGAGGWVIVCDQASAPEIYLMRTDASGTLISTTDLDEPRVGPVGPLAPVSVAFDGEGFGVLGRNSGGLVFTRYVVVP